VKLAIEIIPDTYDTDENGFYCLLNNIKINDFQETNSMAVDYWTKEDYQRQWEEGLEKIKIHNVSCLVTSIQNPIKSIPLLNWWVLYKIDNKIIIQNELLYDEVYKEEIGDKLFSPESCYDFIRPRVTHTEDGQKISEWIVEL
jgi:hypothetical protein